MAVDNRQFVNGVLWVLRSGACWSDLPKRYGKYKSAHMRFMRRARSGVWERIFADLVVDKKNLHLMIDSTSVRAHQQAATAAKRGSKDPALGRSRGGLSTQIHLLADEDGLPLEFRITAGQAGEYAPAAERLEGQQAQAVIADRGYDAHCLPTQTEHLGATAVIPPKRNRKHRRLRSPTVPATQPYQTLLQQAQTLPALRHTLLQDHRSLPLLHGPRLRLAST